MEKKMCVIFSRVQKYCASHNHNKPKISKLTLPLLNNFVDMVIRTFLEPSFQQHNTIMTQKISDYNDAMKHYRKTGIDRPSKVESSDIGTSINNDYTQCPVHTQSELLGLKASHTRMCIHELKTVYIHVVLRKPGLKHIVEMVHTIALGWLKKLLDECMDYRIEQERRLITPNIVLFIMNRYKRLEYPFMKEYEIKQLRKRKVKNEKEK
jgi:hypothetical protein